MKDYSMFLGFNQVLKGLKEEVRRGDISFSDYEKLSYKECMKMMAKDMSNFLVELDEEIRNDEDLGKRYKIQRKLKKNIVTIFDTIEYERTEFYDKQDRCRVKLLDERIGIESYNRFTKPSLEKMIEKATNSSYREAGESINPFDKISKGTVMNKIRALDTEIEIETKSIKKKEKCLYIDADEDHMHSQKNDRKGKKRGDFIGKLIYLYEGYEKECNGRYRLKNRYTISGLYDKNGENKEMWEKMYEYIVNNYDIDYIKKIYIQGDGANWIKEGVNHIPKSEFILDEFHLNKYIDKIVNVVPKHKRQGAYNDIIRTIELDTKERFIDLIDDIKEEITNKKDIEESKEYILNNWEAIIRRILDNNTIGCSAESHVGHILSKRMSRNPMGWSKRSANKICALRALQENYGIDAFKQVIMNTYRSDNNNTYEKEIEAKYYHTEKDKNIKPLNKYNDWLYSEIIGTDNLRKAIISNHIIKKQ